MRLIEIVIAMAIFAAVMVMAIQGVASIRGYADIERIERTLELEGKRGLDRLGADLVDSAWTPSSASPTTNLSTFPRIWKADDAARANAAPPSFPYGDAISFYKLRTEAEIVAGAPTALRAENVAFDRFTPDNVPTPMSQFWKGRPVGSLVLNGGWADNGTANPPPITSVVWECAAPANANSVAAPGVNYATNLDLATLRQYRFVVVPDAQTGLGILVKQWRNVGSAVDTDWPAPVIGADAVEIVRDVVTVSFGSYLTEADDALARLNAYQVRVDLTLAAGAAAGSRLAVADGVARDSYGDAGIVRRFTATFTLRSVTDPSL